MAKTKAAPEQPQDQDSPNQVAEGTPADVSISISASALKGLDASAASLPIEGESKWVSVMRAIACATLGCLLVIAIMFHFLTGSDSFVGSQQLGMMLAGLVFILLIEYLIFLKIVIPGQANYGRYIISKSGVEYFPLTALGLGVREKGESIGFNRFLGVTSSRTVDKKGRVSYAVFLVHGSDKGKTIKVRSFPEPVQADAFAGHVGALLGLNVASGIGRKVHGNRHGS